ncbi:uncharacterized protein K441DRAFT_620108 [Cenococcum geophilum 1.58]|uniref:uncharacterized protein n=1 Tax=Cenococcum geophilum 1.58 TaxID=794803 RepID=UPI00358DF664|nr:hypothetical protein K441DRAFT_620108 [Cenococcum geophilum 1.58]
MKRKFSFNLVPTKAPSKPETKVYKGVTPNRRRDSISPPASPFINRRPLSSKTEAQLRAACALILQDYKPSGHVFEDYEKPKLDFGGLNHAMREKQKAAHSNLPQRPPKKSGAGPSAAPDAKKYGYKPETALKDLFPADSIHPTVQANTSRRRDERPVTSTLDEGELLARARSIPTKQASLKVAKSLGVDRPQTAPNRNPMDSDDTSLHTPLTASTENHYNNFSTAPTSAAFTSTMNSKRTSQQAYVNDSAAALADAAAAEWMKQELEKRRMNMLAQEGPKASSRPPSRSRSIRSEIREYIRPSLSRSASRGSMRSNKSDARQERSSSTHGWRSWTLQRKTSLSSFKDSRPVSARGRSETRSGDPPKPELNLNRELPPLPSLDKWDQQERRPEPNSNQSSKTHIADLMRAKNPSQDEVAAVRRQHRRSGSDSLAKHMSFHEDATLLTPPQNVRIKAKPAVPAKFNSSAPPQQLSGSTTDVSSLARSIEEAKRLKHQRHRSTGDESYKMKTSMDGYPKNFSRKISSDATSAHSRIYDPRHPSAAEVTALPPHPEKPSKLRKVFSSWMLRGKKEKKNNWADKLEQVGTKGGVLVRNEPAHAPVIKY